MPVRMSSNSSVCSTLSELSHIINYIHVHVRSFRFASLLGLQIIQVSVRPAAGSGAGQGRVGVGGGGGGGAEVLLHRQMPLLFSCFYNKKEQISLTGITNNRTVT